MLCSEPALKIFMIRLACVWIVVLFLVVYARLDSFQCEIFVLRKKGWSSYAVKYAGQSAAHVRRTPGVVREQGMVLNGSVSALRGS